MYIPVKIYLAGPMRGYPLYNFPTFETATKNLRAFPYHEVHSPAEHDLAGGLDPAGDLKNFDMEAAFAWDVEQVLWSDRVVLLPGWRDSSGVAIELAVAQATGKGLYEYDSKCVYHQRAITYETITAEADRIVDGARRKSYGHPKENFKQIGDLWATMLGIETVTPQQVGLMMIAAKIARELHSPKRDNLVDIAGYAKTVDLCNRD